MIYLFSGTPGSGKSLDMARCILNDLRMNRPVICNFPISVPRSLKKRADNFHYWNDDELFPANLVSFSDNYFKNHKFREGQIVLYIDECQLLFNARTWNVKGRSDWNAFFTNHRHFGYDVILSCQFDRMIDRQIRSLIEIQIIHRKLNNMGLQGLFFRLLFLSPTLFVKVRIYYPLNERLGAEFYRYNKSYAKIYDSYSSVFIKNDTENTYCSSGSEGDAIPCGEVSPSDPAKRRSIFSIIYDKFAMVKFIYLASIFRS